MIFLQRVKSNGWHRRINEESAWTGVGVWVLLSYLTSHTEYCGKVVRYPSVMVGGFWWDGARRGGRPNGMREARGERFRGSSVSGC